MELFKIGDIVSTNKEPDKGLVILVTKSLTPGGHQPNSQHFAGTVIATSGDLFNIGEHAEAWDYDKFTKREEWEVEVYGNKPKWWEILLFILGLIFIGIPLIFMLSRISLEMLKVFNLL